MVTARDPPHLLALHTGIAQQRHMWPSPASIETTTGDQLRTQAPVIPPIGVHRDVMQATFASTNSGQVAIADAQTEKETRKLFAQQTAEAGAADAEASSEAAAEAIGEETIYAEVEISEPQSE